MFTLRYFPARYFPGHYFPEVGLTPPAPRLGAIKILINGVDRTDYLYYGSPCNWDLMRGARGSCTVPLIIYPGDDLSPQVGESIEIFDPVAIRCWSGTVEGLEIKWIGDGGHHYIILTGVTLERLFDTLDLDKVKYAPGTGGPVTCGDAFTDLFARSGVTAVTLGTVAAGPAVEGLEVTNCATGFSDLATLAGFIWYIDPVDNKLYFTAPGARVVAATLHANDVLWETADWTQNRNDVRDTQVIQMPGLALSAVTASFAGDNVTTSFFLPVVPEYILSITVTPTGVTGKTISWTPGAATVRVSPAPLTGETVVVRYMDAGEQIATTGFTPASGTRTARYTTTRTFTPAGGLQQAVALLARYSMLPAALQFQTDRPGIGIGRKLSIDLAFPLGAGALLNGDWLVVEVSAAIIPGLDQRQEPYGHFRYTLFLVNTAATAVFQGDNLTTLFLLPEVPSAVSSIRVSPNGSLYTALWTVATNQITVTPAPPAGTSIAASYTGANTPDVPSFLSTWNGLTDNGNQTGTPNPQGQNPPPSGDGTTAPPAVFQRTLLIKDTTVGDDIADHVPIYHAGTALRVLGVLRKLITADLTVRIHKIASDFSSLELITATIPLGAVVDEVFEWSLAAGSPAILPPFLDKEVLTADILESDGSSDAEGIASFTVEWEHA